MSNMSYCRFHNTEQDLQDCLNEVEHMLQLDVEEIDLSRMEKQALFSMVEQARYFSELAEELMEKMEDGENKKIGTESGFDMRGI